jgi:hypothetical protein
MQTKFCKKCNKNKDIGQFSVSKNKIQSWCKECVRENIKNKRDNYSTDEHKNSKLIEKYGITTKYYKSLYDHQGGACAICKTRQMPLGVDHDHKTGLIRGLLCDSCNKIIGFAYDSPEVLTAAADYLERHKCAYPILS